MGDFVCCYTYFLDSIYSILSLTVRAARRVAIWLIRLLLNDEKSQRRSHREIKQKANSQTDFPKVAKRIFFVIDVIVVLDGVGVTDGKDGIGGKITG